jgi:hypothetical protein
MAPFANTRRRAERQLDLEHDAANTAELRANTQSVLTAIRTIRPKNTTKGYEPKQDEFKVASLILPSDLTNLIPF